jgi:hypothetical protein
MPDVAIHIHSEKGDGRAGCPSIGKAFGWLKRRSMRRGSADC